jgi:hypothetical protein
LPETSTGSIILLPTTFFNDLLSWLIGHWQAFDFSVRHVPVVQLSSIEFAQEFLQLSFAHWQSESAKRLSQED